jgi:hypothetical protein
VPELLGNVKIDPITTEGAYETKLDSTLIQNERLLGLLRRYTHRQSFSAEKVHANGEMEHEMDHIVLNGELDHALG